MKQSPIDTALCRSDIAMLWPVYGFRAGLPEPVATCFDYDAAVDLVIASERNLYIGEPRDDKRLNATVARDLRFTMDMQAKRRVA